MKLSMWNIADLLGAFEPEVHIRRESPRILRSARLVYATNCVVVSKDGPDCLYTWEEDVIRMPDLSLREGFELLQSLFDIMFDWQGQVEEAIKRYDFQRVVELCNIVFHNPITITDANHACIASSERYNADSVDREWWHMKTYGYSSFASSIELSEAHVSYHLGGDVVHFRFRPDSGMSDNVSASIFYNGRLAGYMSVIEKDHELNDGHMQVMSMLADMLAPALSMKQRGTDSSNSLLKRFLTGEELNDENTLHFMDQRSWKPEHHYRVYAIDFRSHDEEDLFKSTYQHYLSAVAAAFPYDLCGAKDELMILLADDDLMDDQKRRDRLNGLFRDTSVYMGASNSVQGFNLIPMLLEQAMYALEYGCGESSPQRICDFCACAVDYIIQSQYSAQRCLAACHQDIYRLYRQDKMLYETFRAYLMHDCSVSKTVQVLYVHKNTVLYRLRRIEELLGCGLNDSYTKMYMRLSFRLLDRHALSEP